MTFRLLYVCQNNKGRSPALQAFTQYFLWRRGIEGIVVESAGVSVDYVEFLRKQNPGPSRATTHALMSFGLGIENFRIRHLAELERRYDLALAVDQDTLDTMIKNFPLVARKATLTKRYARYKHGPFNIPGPYYYQNKFSQDKWSELLGYELMLNETKNVARRIVKKRLTRVARFSKRK